MCVVLVAEFASEQYTGSESSGFVEVVVIISGGSSTTNISVMVTTSEQTATGIAIAKWHNLTTDYYTLLGSGVDFDSDPINITFVAGEVSKLVNIPVMCDKIVERTESFDISLTLTSNNPQVRSNNGSVINIRDSTGNDGTVVSIGDDVTE